MDFTFSKFQTLDQSTPIDEEFINCISRLATPKKIGAYMLENLVYCDIKEGKPNVRNSYRFWKIKKGNCVDFSEFGAFVANYHGYKVSQVVIIYERISENHVITLYMKDDKMSFTDNQYYFDNHGNWFNDFEEIKVFFLANSPGYPVRKYTILSYENRIKKWSGSNYVKEYQKINGMKREGESNGN